jgi:hypothetical protein
MEPGDHYDAPLNKVLSALISNTCNLCGSFTVTDISEAYKTSGEIIVPYIPIMSVLESVWEHEFF